MLVFIIICIIAAILIAGWFLLGLYGFHYAMGRGRQIDMADPSTLKGTAWEKYYDPIMEGIRWIDSHEMEDVWITSEDGLKLHARLMTHPKASGTVLMVHGYRTRPEIDFSAAAHIYYEAGNNLLLIDQRACGKSEGNYIGFGVLEGRDCRLWARYAAERFGETGGIILAGLSMGATTVLMAAGGSLPSNVCGIVADSAFSSPADIIQNTIHHGYHINGRGITAAIGFWCKRKAGYTLDEGSTLEVAKNIHAPVLFAHGTADTRVPVEMTLQAAVLCPAPKMILISEGAQHGTGFIVDHERYVKNLHYFLVEAGNAYREKRPFRVPDFKEPKPDRKS